MPALAIDHNAESVVQRRFFFEASLDGVQNAPLFFLPLGVQLIESIRNFTGTHRIFHAEQLDNIPRHIHAPSRIQPRSDAKRDFAGSERASRGKLGNFQQCPQPRIHRSTQALQPELGEDAILSNERHCVGDGRNRNHFHK